MPKELEELFKSILDSKAEEPAESLLLMQWICFAEKAMSIQELRWAIVIDADRPGVDDPDKLRDDYLDDDTYIGDDEAMERRIVVLSCGLAEVAAGRVQFIHQAVKEFFLDRGFALLRSKTESENRSPVVATNELRDGHYRIARACIQYLCMAHRSNPEAIGRPPDKTGQLQSIFRERMRYASIEQYPASRSGFIQCPKDLGSSQDDCGSFYRSPKDRQSLYKWAVALTLAFPLIKYALHGWTLHLIASEAYGTEADDVLDYSAWPPENLFCQNIFFPESQQKYQWIRPLHLAAKWQLTTQLQAMVKRAREGHLSMDIEDIDMQTPLSLAAGEGKSLAVQILC